MRNRNALLDRKKRKRAERRARQDTRRRERAAAQEARGAAMSEAELLTPAGVAAYLGDPGWSDPDTGDVHLWYRRATAADGATGDGATGDGTAAEPWRWLACAGCPNAAAAACCELARRVPGVEFLAAVAGCDPEQGETILFLLGERGRMWIRNGLPIQEYLEHLGMKFNDVQAGDVQAGPCFCGRCRSEHDAA
jgi:hypothetical protein